MIKIEKNIKLIVTDFDGVITDGFLYLSSSSEEEVKRVSFKDIMGMSIAIKNNYKVGIISGEKNSIIDKVANKFKLEDVHQGIKDKCSVFKTIVEKYGFDYSETLFIGDDINDIETLKLAGVAVTVPNANYKVKQQVKNILVTEAEGGNGAFREVIDSLTT